MSDTNTDSTPQTPENSPSTPPNPAAATQTSEEPSFGPGGDHFRRLAEVEKQKRQEAEARKAAESKYKQMEELVRLAASDYDRFSAIMGNKPQAPEKQPQIDPAEVALKEVETLKRKLEEAEAEQARKLQEAQFSEAKKKITEYVSDKKEKYPLTVALGFEEAVADMVHQAFLNGQVLSEDQAASEIEKRLAQRKDSLAALFQAAVEPAKPELPTKPSIRTLTQSHQAESPTKASSKPVYENRDVRVESMIAALRSQLKT
jgi:hypothetical protein